MTIKAKEELANIVLIQGEDTYKQKPVNKKLVLVGSRLDEIDDVLCKALTDNTKVLLLEFLLLLPEKDSFKLREMTMRNNKLFELFINCLTPEVETETPELDCYIPNCLRFIARKVYVNESMPYYSYKVALLVNQELYEDVSTCSQYGECLMDKIINAWKFSTKLDYQKIKDTFLKQSMPSVVVDNFSGDKYEQYLGAHKQLSVFASAGRGSHLKKQGSFSCSVI